MCHHVPAKQALLLALSAAWLAVRVPCCTGLVFHKLLTESLVTSRQWWLLHLIVCTVAWSLLLLTRRLPESWAAGPLWGSKVCLVVSCQLVGKLSSAQGALRYQLPLASLPLFVRPGRCALVAKFGSAGAITCCNDVFSQIRDDDGPGFLCSLEYSHKRYPTLESGMQVCFHGQNLI